MIGIYHDKDLDGICSGAIIKKKYPEAKMIGHDYGREFDFDQIDGPVIMADISLPMEDMEKVARLSGNNFTWIDHHISTIKDYKNFIGEGEGFCSAILDIGRAACELTWEYLYPELTVPYAVELLGAYDTWRLEDKLGWGSNILPFQFGMRLHTNSVQGFPFSLLMNDFLVESFLDAGRIVLAYQKSINERQCKRAAFDGAFKGLRAICLNAGGFNSQVFDSVWDEDKYDVMLMFQYNGRFWNCSLYTTKDDVDCSELAKKMGGGGHKKAAGFEVNDISEIIGKN